MSTTLGRAGKQVFANITSSPSSGGDPPVSLSQSSPLSISMQYSNPGNYPPTSPLLYSAPTKLQYIPSSSSRPPVLGPRSQRNESDHDLNQILKEPLEIPSPKFNPHARSINLQGLGCKSYSPQTSPRNNPNLAISQSTKTIPTLRDAESKPGRRRPLTQTTSANDGPSTLATEKSSREMNILAELEMLNQQQVLSPRLTKIRNLEKENKTLTDQLLQEKLAAEQQLIREKQAFIDAMKAMEEERKALQSQLSSMESEKKKELHSISAEKRQLQDLLVQLELQKTNLLQDLSSVIEEKDLISKTVEEQEEIRSRQLQTLEAERLALQQRIADNESRSSLENEKLLAELQEMKETMLLKFSSMENEKQLLQRKLQEAEENSIRQNQLLSEQIEKQRLQSLSVIESLEKEKEALLQQLKQQQQQLQAQQLQQQQMLEEQRRQEELRKEMEEKEKLRRQWAEEKAAISPRRSNPSSAANSPRRAHDVSVAESKVGSPQGPRMTTTVAPPRLETMTVFHKLIREATDLQNAMRESMQYSQHQLKLVNQVLHQEKMGKLKSVVGKMKKEYFQQKRGIESIREEDEHHDDVVPSSSSNYPGGESKMSSTPLSPTMSFHNSPAMGGKMRKEISKKGVVPPSPMLKSRESSARFGISEASRGAATGLIGAAVGIAGGIGLAGGIAGGVASAGLGLAGGIAGGLAVGGLSAGMTAGIAMGQAIAATPGKPLGPKGSFMQGAPAARGAGGMMTPKASFSAGPGGAGKSLLTPKASFVAGGGPPRPKMSLFHMANEANQQNLQLMHQQQSAHLNTQSSPSKELVTAGQGQSMQSPLLQGQSGRPPLGKSSAPAAPAAQLAEGTSSTKQPAPAIEAAKADVASIPLAEKPVAPESDPAAPLVESKASEPNSSTEQQPSADDEKKESTPGDLAKDPHGETKEEDREVKEQAAKSLEVETSEATQSAADQPYWEYAEQSQEQQEYYEDGQYHLSDQQNEGFDDYYNNELFQDLPDPHIAAAVGDLARLQQLDAADPSLLESVDSVGRQPLFYAVMNSQHHVMDWIFSLLDEVQEGSEQSYPQEEVLEEQQPQATTVPADEPVPEEKQEPATEQQQANDAVVQQEEVPTEPVAQQTEQSVSPAEEKVAESHEPISSATEEQVTAEEKADISLSPSDPVNPAEQAEVSIAEEPAATAQQQEPAGEESADYSAATSGRNVVNIFSMFSHYDQFGDTILHAAAATGSLVSLEKILTAHQRQIEMYPTYYEYIFLPEQFENEEDRARYIESYTYNYVNIQNFHGMTPIHLSATGQSIEKLITFGGDLSVTDQFRRTPLFIACVVNKESCVEYLIGYSDFSDEMLLAKDCFGDTPLHAAAGHGSVESLLLLLQCGVDPRVTNEQGLKAIDLSVRNKHQRCRDILAEYHLHYCTPSEFDSVLFLAVLEGHRKVSQMEYYGMDYSYGSYTSNSTAMDYGNPSVLNTRQLGANHIFQAVFSLNSNKTMRLKRYGPWIAYHDPASEMVFWYHSQLGTGQWETPEEVLRWQQEEEGAVAQTNPGEGGEGETAAGVEGSEKMIEQRQPEGGTLAQDRSKLDKTLRAQASMRLKREGDWVQYQMGATKMFWYNEKNCSFRWENPFQQPVAQTQAQAQLAQEQEQEQQAELVEQTQTSRRGSQAKRKPRKSSAAPLPTDWEMHLDSSSGQFYWFNRITQASQWDNPFETHDEAVDHSDGLVQVSTADDLGI